MNWLILLFLLVQFVQFLFWNETTCSITITSITGTGWILSYDYISFNLAHLAVDQPHSDTVSDSVIHESHLLVSSFVLGIRFCNSDISGCLYSVLVSEALSADHWALGHWDHWSTARCNCVSQLRTRARRCSCRCIIWSIYLSIWLCLFCGMLVGRFPFLMTHWLMHLRLNWQLIMYNYTTTLHKIYSLIAIAKIWTWTWTWTALWITLTRQWRPPIGFGFGFTMWMLLLLQSWQSWHGLDWMWCEWYDNR